MRRLLVEAGKRHSRVPHEAEDLAHDIVLAALRRGLPLTSEAFVRGAQGSARRHGAFLARSAVRRRARELRAATELLAPSHAEVGVELPDEVGPPHSLSPALETTLSLLVLGLDKAELRCVLGLSDAALRKRFEALRRVGPLTRPKLHWTPRSAALTRLRRSQVGLLPRLADLVAGGWRAARVLGVGDPDGHGLIFTEVLTAGRPTATADAPAPHSRAPEKGTPCSTASSRTSRSSST